MARPGLAGPRGVKPPPFLIAQTAALVLFVVLWFLAVVSFRSAAAAS